MKTAIELQRVYVTLYSWNKFILSHQLEINVVDKSVYRKKYNNNILYTEHKKMMEIYLILPANICLPYLVHKPYLIHKHLFMHQFFEIFGCNNAGRKIYI